MFNPTLFYEQAGRSARSLNFLAPVETVSPPNVIGKRHRWAGTHGQAPIGERKGMRKNFGKKIRDFRVVVKEAAQRALRARSISRFSSRSRIVRRLSYSRFPLTRASVTLARPPLK